MPKDELSTEHFSRWHFIKWQIIFQTVGERTRPPNHFNDFLKTQLTITWLNYQVQKKAVILNQYHQPPRTLLLVFCAAFSCWLGQNPSLLRQEKNKEAFLSIWWLQWIQNIPSICTFSPHTRNRFMKSQVTSASETRELELPAEDEVLYCCISQLLLLDICTSSPLPRNTTTVVYCVSLALWTHFFLGTEIPGSFKLLLDWASGTNQSSELSSTAKWHLRLKC